MAADRTAETIVHADAHLVVACKPHFLPVAPTGAWVRETLLARLVRRLGNPALVPLHRIDRDTAGVVLFSADPASRGAVLRESIYSLDPAGMLIDMNRRAFDALPGRYTVVRGDIRQAEPIQAAQIGQEPPLPRELLRRRRPFGRSEGPRLHQPATREER